MSDAHHNAEGSAARLIPPTKIYGMMESAFCVRRTGEATVLGPPTPGAMKPYYFGVALFSLLVAGGWTWLSLRQTSYPVVVPLAIGGIAVPFMALGLIAAPMLKLSQSRARGPAIVRHADRIEFPRAGWSGTRRDIERLELVTGTIELKHLQSSANHRDFYHVCQLQFVPTDAPPDEAPALPWQTTAFRVKSLAERASRAAGFAVAVREAPDIKVEM